MQHSSTRLGLVCGLSLLLLGGGGCRCQREGSGVDWIARAVTVQGAVTVSGPGRAKAAAVAKGTEFKLGDRLETGPRAHAVLALRNGGKLRVRPNSVVHFRARAANSRVSVSLEQGAVVGSAPEEAASALTIMVGGRRVRLDRASRALVAAASAAQGVRVEVALGQAMVEGPAGESRTIVAGDDLTFTAPGQRREPDAARKAPDAAAVDAGPDAAQGVPATSAGEALFLRAGGRGRVLVKLPGAKGFRRIRGRQWAAVPRGATVRLTRRARAQVTGDRSVEGTVLIGPTTLRIGGGAGQEPSALQHVRGDLHVVHKGTRGSSGAAVTLGRVRIVSRVRHQRVDVRVRQKGGRYIVSVRAGEAVLQGKGGAVTVEAGQEATIHAGRVIGPRNTPVAPFQIRHFGTVRVFTNDRRLPVTFRWKREEDATASLVEVSRRPNMSRPLFADVIRRRVLTIPDARRGALYWRVTPILPSGDAGEKARRGKLLLVRDTSSKGLNRYRAPNNTIHESYGNTTVFYQNRLPRFTFRWNPIAKARRYELKVYREQNLRSPLVRQSTTATELTLPPGKLGEGTYIWYVVGRAADSQLVRALKGRKLGVRYDNATPDIQIVTPRNGITVDKASIVAGGVTIPGSKLYINGVEAAMDRGYRFKQDVAIKPGVNYITFRVVRPRRGSSVYLRRVVRK